MAKYIEVCYTGTWFTTIEVPDDFEFIKKNVVEAMYTEEQAGAVDFQDGGADWTLSSAAEVNEDGELVSKEIALTDE